MGRGECVRLFGPIGYEGRLDGVLAISGGEDLAVGKSGDYGGGGEPVDRHVLGRLGGSR
jgi:hypothetical protein